MRRVKTWWVLIGAMAFAAGCTATQPFERGRTVEWRFAYDMCGAASQLRAEGFMGSSEGCTDWFGFAAWNGTRCVMVTPRPTNVGSISLYDTIIHEVRHCVEGQFH